jgi:arginine metabolism regulation protein II
LKQARKLIDMHIVGTRSQGSSFKSSKVAALHQIYSYLQIIYNSTHVSKTVHSYGDGDYDHDVSLLPDDDPDVSSGIYPAAPSSHLEQANLDSLSEHKDDYQLFARIYGVPRSLLTLISRVSSLAREIEAVEDSSSNTHPSMTDIFRPHCQELEDQICSWHASDDELSPMESWSMCDPQVRSHLVQAMHDALIVMFFRRVRQVNRVVLQHYVESAVDHLNEQEEVKGRAGVNAPALLWPWFMVASEAIRPPIRQKLSLWSNLARRYGGRNLEVAEQVVQEVWRRHDQKLANASWVDVVRDWHVTLVLT